MQCEESEKPDLIGGNANYNVYNLHYLTPFLD